MNKSRIQCIQGREFTKYNCLVSIIAGFEKNESDSFSSWPCYSNRTPRKGRRRNLKTFFSRSSRRRAGVGPKKLARSFEEHFLARANIGDGCKFPTTFSSFKNNQFDGSASVSQLSSPQCNQLVEAIETILQLQTTTSNVYLITYNFEALLWFQITVPYFRSSSGNR